MAEHFVSRGHCARLGVARIGVGLRRCVRRPVALSDDVISAVVAGYGEQREVGVYLVSETSALRKTLL